ncbi:hypothetical protein Zmor_027158 [Zophobas morio]|uniref:Gustatory receptor n=1 Tax=Zophobas morio TaxID=2755281 RepID=A0AA38HT49_9CUCU|nr:hypothetical protein Zmor_027158 [Zophobas morio]
MKKSKILTVDDVLAPVTFARTVLGMAPYHIQNGRLTYHKIRSLICLVTIITITTITAYFLLNLEVFLNTQATIVGTIKAVIIIRRIGSVVALLVTIGPSRSNFIKILKIRHDLNQIDERLSKFGCKEEINQSNYIHRKKIIFLLLLSSMVLVLGEVVIMKIFISSFETIQALVFTYPVVVMKTINTSFHGTTLILQARFNCINTLFSTSIPLDKNFSKNVQHLTLIHRDLVQTSRRLNRVFNLQLLLWIFLNSVLLIGDLHAATYVVVFRLSGKLYRVLVISVKNCLTYSFDFYYLCKRCKELCYEANRTRILLLGVRLPVNNKEDERDTVITSALNLLNNKLEITACRLFRVDYTLLFSICGVAFSYLFIVLQLEVGDVKRSADGSFSNTSVY